MPAHADFVCRRCFETDPETAGPYRDLPLGVGGHHKPRCPNCGARRWMEQQFSNYRVLVSTPEGRNGIAASELAGPEIDRQRGARPVRQFGNPMGDPMLVGMNGVGQAVETATKGKIAAHQVAFPSGEAKPSRKRLMLGEAGAMVGHSPMPMPTPLLAAKPYTG